MAMARPCGRGEVVGVAEAVWRSGKAGGYGVRPRRPRSGTARGVHGRGKDTRAALLGGLGVSRSCREVRERQGHKGAAARRRVVSPTVATWPRAARELAPSTPRRQIRAKLDLLRASSGSGE